MTKVDIIVSSDTRTKNRRAITVLITTDDSEVNKLLGTPYPISKTYDKNDSVSDIKKDIKQEVTSLIGSIKSKLKEDDMTNRKFTIQV